jgi:hypothetical protein
VEATAAFVAQVHDHAYRTNDDEQR